MKTNTETQAPALDLTQRPPRSPRSRLGGYVILPRILDKARARHAGTIGDYVYNSTLDGLFFRFVGLNPDELFEQVKTGAGDWQILKWIETKISPKQPWEISAWSDYAADFTFHDLEGREWLTDEIRRINPDRDDIQTIFDRIDLDDYISFGGKA
ncbi:MAG: DUF5069 domain-containing protein [Terrimicrobiaceae bacterium]|nr:DUF5069 domain-containing protein [Terrimicrobiaceae bacterium]